MAPLDTVSLPVLSDDAPAGENLELTADFGALENASRGKPEVQYGNTIEPPVPPDWKEVEALAQEMMGRTRDLRVMVHLAVARLHLRGIQGFAEMLWHIREQVDLKWDSVHPQLDPEDDNDPMQRSNALLRLQDPANVLRTLRDLPLAGSKRKVEVTWRDIAISNGAMEPDPKREKLTESSIRGAFRDTDPARLMAQQDAFDLAAKESMAIPAAFDGHAGAASGPDFKELTKLLHDVQKELKRFQPLMDEPEADAPADADAPVASEGNGSARAPRGFASVQSITAVTSREDAMHLLEVASGYFRANEPSSPLPLLIERAKRLVGKDFLEILQDLAPDGISQVRVIAGTTE